MSKQSTGNRDGQPAAPHIVELIILKSLGYLLLLLGVAGLLLVGWQAWQFFQQPELVTRFAQALSDNAGDLEIPFSLLKFAAWQVVLVLLLTAGKISTWLIDGGRKLIC